MDYDGDSGGTTLLGIVILLCMIGLTWVLPRRSAVIPLLITTCYIPLGQSFVILGAHFPFFRILLLVGWCRTFVRRENRDLAFTGMDKIFFWWALVTLVVGSFTQPSVFMDRFINRMGEVYTAAGTYFLIRCWIRSLDDLVAVLRTVAVMIVPLAISMLLEKFSGRNIFYVFGGVPEFTEIREGRLRCQGAFRHPILAGTYGATLFPLFVGLWFQPQQKRFRAIVGILSSLIVTMASASSGPLLAFLGAVAGFAAWRLRFRMQWIRRGIVAALIVLAFTMNAPIWYIIARVSEITGGTGWYRSFLIDQAISHFDEWWLAGSRYTAHWAPGGEVMAGNPGNTDIINHYVYEALDGGIWKLGLLIAMIVAGFKIVGRFTRSPEPLPFSTHILIWSTGVCLLGHCLSFLSVAYFDQIVVMWYWLLAILAMLSSAKLTIESEPAH